MQTGIEETGPIQKLVTGISGFEYVSMGGLPRGRTTLVSGNVGCGKTVFAAQFLAEGVRRGEPGVFVTFEESPADIRRNMAGFGWEVVTWEAENRWAFVDASPEPEEQDAVAGEYQPFHWVTSIISGGANDGRRGATSPPPGGRRV